MSCLNLMNQVFSFSYQTYQNYVALENYRHWSGSENFYALTRMN